MIGQGVLVDLGVMDTSVWLMVRMKNQFQLYKQDKINLNSKSSNALIDARSFFILENKNKGQLDLKFSEIKERK